MRDSVTIESPIATVDWGLNLTYTHGHHESVLRSRKSRTIDNSAAYLSAISERSSADRFG
jgi:hypothetical protein